MARKHVCAPLRRNAVPTDSHSDGQNARYFPRTLRTVLLELGFSEPRTSSRPEAAAWELIPLACTRCDLREAYDRSYLPHPPSG
jgi:hypothetical protein